MNRKGQALVEFVLILPIFILMLFAIVDFGMILSKKNNIDDIKNLYPKVKINISSDDKYTKIIISDDVDIMTPGLNRILGNPYNIKVERTIPNVKA